MFKKALWFVLTLCIFSLPASTYNEKFTMPKDDIIFIPLDSRPVNTQNVSLLTNMWGKNLILPPQNVLDDYTKPGNFEGLNEWLNEVIPRSNVYAVVISLQQYLNGGLIASRDIKNYKDYEERLSLLYKFLTENENKNIIIFSIIPRLTPTQFSDYQYVKYSDRLKEFSELSDKVDLFNQEKDKTRLEKIKKSIPPDVLTKYIELFELNKGINEKLIDWTKEGYIKTLVIGIDDTQKFSMSNMVARKLNQYAKTQQISNKVYVLHGADEIGMEITARLANEYYKQIPRFNVVYDVKDPDKVILPYEGADLKKIVEEKINFIGGKTDSSGECILYVHTHENLGIKNDIQKYKNKGQIFGIADVAYVNMADKKLIDLLFDLNPLSFLYAGWNTPSNAIGTVISEMSLKMVLDKSILPSYKEEDAIKSFIAFSFIRYADDFAYQADVRNKMYKWAESNHMAKDNIDKKTADEELSIKMKPLINTIKGKYIGELVKAGNSSVGIKDIEVKVRYPWNRMFEIEVLPKIILQQGS
ncbi:hypothetical protein Tmath_2163 [Thermoanaerobacter mathranii subsp. mathranii str. A3]|uniref:DUF4127 family protein n=1 Tax=Thermoanaerobacter mathranii subsp. mathranii (strain DSM 11426 / CCUG 53645 / CIP 108742 / A3) TaxID=583358 RepID=A0ABN3Z6B0_THEM3|nr:DUF4127 family protein [Thermoanaerobacter mathranii]ADH61835.1 hypothetical protein Tmath_2163 [Thermoanaerobacter mathranii subsp. mathranii str. A3]